MSDNKGLVRCELTDECTVSCDRKEPHEKIAVCGWPVRCAKAKKIVQCIPTTDTGPVTASKGADDG